MYVLYLYKTAYIILVYLDIQSTHLWTHYHTQKFMRVHSLDRQILLYIVTEKRPITISLNVSLPITCVYGEHRLTCKKI